MGRLSPRNLNTIAHWVILQEAGDRVLGNEGVCQWENLRLSRQSRHIHSFVHKIIKDLNILLEVFLVCQTNFLSKLVMEKQKKTRPAKNIERKNVQMNRFGHEITLLTHVVNYTRRLERLKKRSSAKTMKIMPLKRRSSLGKRRKNFESCDFLLWRR